ncbi:MAG: hypothetical protein ACREAY_09355 [Nitrososphaera sp.]|uniref:hypothetical protein n=1 Tax=Nitrososphaera sp. TaxID=1971748 RepID=UPI003D6E8DE9
MSFAKIFELKETAKWSSKVDEKRNAISELAGFGSEAVNTLEEIRSVEVNDEIRQLCAEAIRKAKGTIEANLKEPEKKAGGPEKGSK